MARELRSKNDYRAMLTLHIFLLMSFTHFRRKMRIYIFILMKASKDIHKGEELLYNYNGRLGEYDTQKFKKLDI